MTTRLRLLSAVLCVAAALGSGRVAVAQGGASPAPAIDRFVLVNFASVPEGAAVFVDGKAVCDRTPCARNVVAGTREIRMDLGNYEPHAEKVVLEAGGDVRFTLEPMYGYLTVTAPVPGLDVSVDGAGRGRTPVERLYLPPGPHEVTTASPCHHPEARRVEIERGKELKLTITGRPKEGTINVTAEDEKGDAIQADILVDGEKKGVTPGIFKVSTCARELALVYRGTTHSQPLAVADQAVVRVAAHLTLATPGATAIAASVNHACIATSRGKLQCWGDGQGPAPADIEGAPRPRALAAGLSFTCALDDGGAVWCWGHNDSGQLGDGTKSAAKTPVQIKELQAKAIAAGYRHACALTPGGAVRCWGDNMHGQLGVGNETDTQICRMSAPCAQIPLPVVGIADAVSLAAGADHTCAVLKYGAVRCWGENSYGQLGNGTTAGAKVPVPVRGITNAVAVAAGAYHTCAALSDGTVRCWGLNHDGRTGADEDAKGDSCKVKGIPYPCRKTPGPVRGLLKAASITAGGDHSCALLDDGAVKCWGRNVDGRLGNGTIEGTAVPQAVKGLGKASAIVAGGAFTCALLRDGAVACWGRDQDGVLGIGRSPAPDTCEVETETDRVTFRCARRPVFVKGVAGK